MKHRLFYKPMTLGPILIADIINPVLFAIMVYAVSTKQPIANSISILIGHTVAYFSAGLVLTIGLEQITDRLANPLYIDFVISLIIGLLLLWVAYKSTNKTIKTSQQESKDLTPLKALGLGAVINFVGIPFALPYFAALGQILKTDFTVVEALLVILSYNLLYALPFTIVPILVISIGDRSRPLLQRINNAIERFNRLLMPILLLVIGLALTIDAIYYFVTGIDFLKKYNIFS